MAMRAVDGAWLIAGILSLILVLLMRRREGPVSEATKGDIADILGDRAAATVIQHLEDVGALGSKNVFTGKLEEIFGSAAAPLISHITYLERPSAYMSAIAILVVLCSVAQLSIPLQSGHITILMAERIKDLLLGSSLCAAALVVGRYPRRLVSGSRGHLLIGPLALIVLGSALAPLDPPEGSERLPILGDASVIYSIGILLYSVAIVCFSLVQAKRARGFRRAQVLVLGSCSVVLCISIGLRSASSGFRLWAPPITAMDVLPGFAMLALVSMFHVTTTRYRLLDMIPIRETSAARGSPRLRLNKGSTYLFDDDDLAQRAFSELVAAGSPGLCLTRTYPERMRRRLGFHRTPIIWLTREKSHPDALGSSNISFVAGVLMSFLDKAPGGVVYCDGIEYLVASNDFDRILKCIYDVNDRISSSGSLLLLVVPSECFDERQLVLLERDAVRIFSRGHGRG